MDLLLELETFKSFADTESEHCHISLAGSSILNVKSKSNITPHLKSKITVGFLALVHGNEYLGLPILNSLLKNILNGKIEIPCDLYFGLGNIPAAMAKKRFIEEDMNRCFGKTDTQSQEAGRARELEIAMLDHCDYVLDIHQTISEAANPFFIFQYTSERCLAIMEEWNSGIPVILQKDQLGENTGLCADEYIRSRGNFGAALELGKLGTSEHFDLGFDICKKVLKANHEKLLAPQEPQSDLKFPVLQLNGCFKAQDSTYKLDQGWKNLQFFTQGQRLGEHAQGIIEAPVSGYILFPRHRPVVEGESLFHYCT